MAKKSIGLESIKMGLIAGDGGMGTTLTQIGATVSDSASITTEEGTTTDFPIEENDAPFFSIQSTAQKQTLAWSTYDVDLDTMARFYGGTVVVGTGGEGDSWDMPDTLPVLERSIEVITKDGWRIQIPRASINTKMQWNLSKTKLAQLDITATILQPTKTGVKKANFREPAA